MLLLNSPIKAKVDPLIVKAGWRWYFAFAKGTPSYYTG
jgi:hypothetical protein